MKIAVVTVATNTIPRFRIDMIEEFVRRRCEVVVMGDEPAGEWAGYLAEHGAWYRRYRVQRNGMNPIADLATLRELTRLMKAEQPDKVFTYQAKGNIYGALAAHAAGVGEIYPMVAGLGSVFNTENVKSRVIGQLVRVEYCAAMRYATRAFFQNREDSARFEEYGIIDNSQVVLTHGSGVNLEQFPQRPLPKDISFLFVGRLVRSKGILDFLEAARIVKATHPGVRIDVVGPFDSNPSCISKQELQEFIADGTVVYHGEQVNMQPFYERCTAFVLPSYYGEGTPKSALEAMATGRPLIVADAVGCREVVRQGVNGFMVPPRDSATLASTMLEIAENPALVRLMAAESRRMAEDVFNVRKVNAVICDAMGI